MGYLCEKRNRGLRQAFLAVLVFCLLLELTKSSAGGEWNYEPGDSGPEHWSQKYPDCGKTMQSPINIDTSKVVYDNNLKAFDFSDYNITDGVTMKLQNKGGHTAELIVSGTPMFLKSGNIPHSYKLEQMHFHWGFNDSRGSEHSIDGNFYPMEIHIVHRENIYTTVEEAAKSPFGLAVVSMLVTAGKENAKFNKLIDFINKIPNPNNEVKIPTFPLWDLLPENFDYYRYYGSLTTPPCYESVIWSIRTDPIQMSEEQSNSSLRYKWGDNIKRRTNSSLRYKWGDNIERWTNSSSGSLHLGRKPLHQTLIV